MADKVVVFLLCIYIPVKVGCVHLCRVEGSTVVILYVAVRWSSIKSSTLLNLSNLTVWCLWTVWHCAQMLARYR